ncbi:MAG TPA: lactate utilization protein [Candidatus Binataceae bacterium]|nr:lactate utilization protein [Candidatus Binataceae bacterium]
MAELHKIVARLKTALETAGAGEKKPPAEPAPVRIPPHAHRAELASTFARELEAVAGRFLGILTPDEAVARIVEVARERNAQSIAVGEGVANDTGAIAAALTSAGISVVRPGPVADPAARIVMRERIARCALGVAEAHYAIAATGTVAMLSSAGRPNSLTLVPPASLVLVQVDGLVPDLAALLATIGPEAAAAQRITLITGPSRTADIEKRIVVGVHGPKSLDVILVWPRE